MPPISGAIGSEMGDSGGRVGKHAPGLSASTVGRLKESWQQDYDLWCRRSLAGRRSVYIWADGIHSNIRLGEDDRVCMLVVMGATLDGTKELIAVESGYRESTISWKSVLSRIIPADRMPPF